MPFRQEVRGGPGHKGPTILRTTGDSKPVKCEWSVSSPDVRGPMEVGLWVETSLFQRDARVWRNGSGTGRKGSCAD